MAWNDAENDWRRPVGDSFIELGKTIDSYAKAWKIELQDSLIGMVAHGAASGRANSRNSVLGAGGALNATQGVYRRFSRDAHGRSAGKWEDKAPRLLSRDQAGNAIEHNGRRTISFSLRQGVGVKYAHFAARAANFSMAKRQRAYSAVLPIIEKRLPSIFDEHMQATEARALKRVGGAS